MSVALEYDRPFVALKSAKSPLAAPGPAKVLVPFFGRHRTIADLHIFCVYGEFSFGYRAAFVGLSIHFSSPVTNDNLTVSHGRHSALAKNICRGVLQAPRISAGLATIPASALALDVATFSRCGSYKNSSPR